MMMMLSVLVMSYLARSDERTTQFQAAAAEIYSRSPQTQSPTETSSVGRICYALSVVSCSKLAFPSDVRHNHKQTLPSEEASMQRPERERTVQCCKQQKYYLKYRFSGTGLGLGP
ncbi:hypothetical protein RvY_11424 [Ramazzottius varieornatus]|uniref:Secreted protein n=1 Tax=Ramazzottius varieornatus TaxID=947166 RepID=A0A1D1VLH4_RAMVA|nr:hypothetical protein RvY_11424 [Ramazzottius varieornatus]